MLISAEAAAQWQLERHQTQRGSIYEASPSLLLLHAPGRRRIFYSKLWTTGASAYVAHLWIVNLTAAFIQEKKRKNKPTSSSSSRRRRKYVKLTPVLRSGYPPCAAVSLVVLSPTREGRVCDIQLVIIAMVLSTTPIFSKGTDIFALCFGLLFKPSSFYRLRRETREARHVAQCSLMFHPGLRFGWSFFGHLQRDASGAMEERTETGRSR